MANTGTYITEVHLQQYDNGKELTNNAENPAGNIIHVVVKKTKIFEPTRRVGYYTIKYFRSQCYWTEYSIYWTHIPWISNRKSV